MFGLKPSDIDLILKPSNTILMSKKLYFSFQSHGDYKPGSDVDIALKGSLSDDSLSEITAQLNERLPLPYKFDVIAYSCISNESLIEHVNRYGKILYQK